MSGKKFFLVFCFGLVGCGGAGSSDYTSQNESSVESTLTYNELKGEWESGCMYSEMAYIENLNGLLESQPIKERFILRDNVMEVQYDFYEDVSCIQSSDLSLDSLLPTPILYEIHDTESLYSESGFEALYLKLGKDEFSDPLEFYRIGDSLYRDSSYYDYTGIEPTLVKIQVEYVLTVKK